MPKGTALCSWLYHYALPQKNKNCLFSIPCVCVGIKFTSNRLRVCLFCVWDVGCATANRHSRFNQLTNHSVQFNSCSYASLPERQLPFSVISNRHAEAKSWKWASGWCIKKKKTHIKIYGKSIIQKSFSASYNQRGVPSMWSSVLASSVLGTVLSPMVECMMSNNASTWNVISQMKSDGKYAEDFPLIFMGHETHSINFGHNSSENTFHKFLCSVQHRSVCSWSWHLFWRMFPQKQIVKEDYIYIYTTLKIWLLHLISDFATLKSNEGLAAVCVCAWSNEHILVSLKTLGSYNMGCHKLLMPRLRAVLCRFMAVKGLILRLHAMLCRFMGMKGLILRLHAMLCRFMDMKGLILTLRAMLYRFMDVKGLILRLRAVLCRFMAVKGLILKLILNWANVCSRT